ncbi:MAG TPA: MFS transporter [Caldimonas sp.]|nr:MFS transporter [Caldimonas sp.]HEX4233267.1 MFS transporter [Caldimonas sp.]
MSTGAAAPDPAAAPAIGGRRFGHVRWSLLFGNFVIGCGVMAPVGTLPDIARSLDVSVAVAGQLIAVAAAVMCFGAPLLAGWVGALDRRKLLAAALAWYAIGHALCALMPSFAALLLVRAVTVLGAAVFTPQAAAAIGAMSPPARRAGAITFIFIGWSVASVVGMPVAAWLGDTFGWRSAFFAIAAVGLVGAVWVLATIPVHVRPATLTLEAWRAAFSNPVLMAIVVVTALAGAGQFTLFSYFAPYFKEVAGAGTREVTLLFVCFGVFGVIGNTLASRQVDRFGPDRTVGAALVLMALSLLAWPLATSAAVAAVVLVPWALACFSTQSLQQARLGAAAPALAPALMALNTSAIYLGQAAGAAGGGWLIARHGYSSLSMVGLAWVAAAIALSVWATRARRRSP